MSALNVKHLDAPAANEHQLISLDSAGAVSFGFDLVSASFERVNNDLNITLEDGGVLTITGFFTREGGASLPEFVLGEGESIASADFLESFMDISTAAGPDILRSHHSESGLTPFLEGTNFEGGNLVGGVSRLGALGTEKFSATGEVSEAASPFMAMAGGQPAGPMATAQVVAPVAPDQGENNGSQDGPGNGGNGGEVPQGEPGDGNSNGGDIPDIDLGNGGVAPGPAPEPTYPFDARVVLYTTDNSSPAISMADLGSSTYTLAPEIAGYFTAVMQNGQLVLQLTAEGVAAQKEAGGSLGGSMTVLGADGQEYLVEVVVTDNEFASSGKLNGGDFAFVEWHQGGSLNNGSIVAGVQSDHLRFAGDVNNSSISSTAGQNYLGINGTLRNSDISVKAGEVQIGSAATATALESANGGSTISGGAVSITAKGQGLYAGANGANIISTTEDVRVGVTGAANTTARGLVASGGENSISGEAIAVEALASGRSAYAYGLQAENNGTNTLDAASSVDIKTESQNNYGNYGLYATGGKNEILSSSGADVRISGSTGSSNMSSALHADLKGANRISTSGEVLLRTVGMGMEAKSGGQNTVENADKVTVSAGYGHAMYATDKDDNGKVLNGSGNLLSNVGDVSLSANSMGMYAQSNSSNTIDGARSVTSITGSEAMSAAANSSNTITNVSGNVSLTSKNATGMYAATELATNNANLGLTPGSNTISRVDGDVSITSKSQGMIAFQGGQNRIEQVAGDVTINGSAGMYADGDIWVDKAKNVHGSRLSENTITNVGGDVALNTTGTAMFAANGSGNSITRVTGDVTLQGSEGMRAWIQTQGNPNSGNNLIQDVGGNVSINTTANMAMYAYGIAAGDIKGSNIIDRVAGSVSLSTGSASSSGMSASGSGSNIISNVGEDVHIKSSGSGMSTTSDGMNKISGVGGEVNITAATSAMTSTSGVGQNIIEGVHKVSLTGGTYGMNAAGGTNSIIAANDGEGFELRITVPAGQGATAYAMYAGNKNTITGSTTATNDINITGNISATASGKNIITTGSADDHVTLNGAVSKGGLSLQLGDGYDVLTLKAANFTEFLQRYGDWLKDIMSNPQLVSVDKVEVFNNGTGAWSVDDMSKLSSYFGGKEFASIDLEFNTGADGQAYVSPAAAAFSAASFMSMADEGLQQDGTDSTPMAFAMAMADVAGSDAVTDASGMAAGHVDVAVVQDTGAGHQPVETAVLQSAVAAEPAMLAEQGLAHEEATSLAHDPVAVSADVTAAGHEALTGYDAEAGAEASSILPVAESVDLAVHDAGAVSLPAADADGDSLGFEGDGSEHLMLLGDDALLLNLDNLQDFDAMQENLGGIDGIGSLWLNLENQRADVIGQDFLAKAFNSMGGVTELHLMVDAQDSVVLRDDSGWQQTETAQMGMDAHGDTIVFDTYQQVSGDETLTLYVQCNTGAF